MKGPVCSTKVYSLILQVIFFPHYFYTLGMKNLFWKSWGPCNLFSFSGDSVCILFGSCHAESDADWGQGGPTLGFFALSGGFNVVL